MTLLVVSDIHYNLKQLDWLLSVADRYEAVILAGDLLDLAGHADLDTQIVVVMKYLDRLREKTLLAVCSGNHDGDAKNEADEYICQWLQKARAENLFVDGDSFPLGESLVCVCPWWDGPISREEMVEFIRTERDKPRKKWFWVHHAPPDKSPVSWTGSKDAGDSFFRSFLESHDPDFAFSGHIHGSPFQDNGAWVDKVGSTWVFNPGRQIGPVPSYIEIDLDTLKAAWFSYMGIEEIDLAGDGCEATPL